MSPEAPPTSPSPAAARLKPLLDFGPLLVFFVVNLKWGILPATAALVPLSVVALLASWRLEGQVSRLALYSTVALVVFGGTTLLLGDESFVKIKVTVIYALFGGVLAFGLLRKKSLLKDLLGQNLNLTDAGWYLLTIRFALFFFALAGLNEVLRRQLSNEAWGTFKVFGVTGMTFLFMVLQVPLMKKHEREPEA